MTSMLIAKLLIPLMFSSSPVPPTHVRPGPVVMFVADAHGMQFAGGTVVPVNPPPGPFPSSGDVLHANRGMAIASFRLDVSMRYMPPAAAPASSGQGAWGPFGLGSLFEAIGQAEQQCDPSQQTVANALAEITSGFTYTGGTGQSVYVGEPPMSQAQRNAQMLVKNVIVAVSAYDPMVPQLIQAWLNQEPLRVGLLDTTVWDYSDMTWADVQNEMNQLFSSVQSGTAPPASQAPGDHLGYGYAARLTNARVQSLSLIHPFGHGPILYVVLTCTGFADSHGANYRSSAAVGSFATMNAGSAYARAGMPAAQSLRGASYRLSVQPNGYGATSASAIAFFAKPQRVVYPPTPTDRLPHVLLTPTDRADDLHLRLPTGVNGATVDTSYASFVPRLLQAWQSNQPLGFLLTCASGSNAANKRTWTIPSAWVTRLAFTNPTTHGVSFDLSFPRFTDSLRPTAIVAPRTATRTVAPRPRARLH